MIRLIHNTKSTKNLIVFIHGFIGDEKTWIKDDKTKPFIDLFLNDNKVYNNFDIGFFQYHSELLSLFPKTKSFIGMLTSRKTAFNLPITEISRLLESQLRYSYSQYENIVLIGHSMGGLVAKRFILDDISKNSTTRVKLYVSLATPHSGSNLATYGKTIINNFQIKDLSPLSESISAMSGEWVQCKQLPKRIYAQGSYDTVVPKVSSVAFDSEPQEIVYCDEDHFSIITPQGKSVVVDAVITELHQLLKEPANTSIKNRKRIESLGQLSDLVSNINSQEYIQFNETIKDLTPTAEYEIDISKVIGRENDLLNIKEEINLDYNKITVLKSIGGIGKTTLLKSYVKENKRDYSHIIWVFNQNGLTNSFVNNLVLLENLNFSLNSNISEFENYKLIMNGIKKLSGKTLLLIDDLKDDSFEIYSQLPLSENCQIIGTTRINLTHSFINLFNVGFLDFDSAKILFSQHYTGTVDTEILNDLFNFVGYHTLTIELLAKTLETNFVINGVGELIDYLKNQTISNENWQVAIQSEYDYETISLKNHLLNAFKLISLCELETKILSYFSVLPTLQFSGKELKKLFSIEDSQDVEFIDSLNSLMKKGWLIALDNLYQMHTMIQEVIKIAIFPNLPTNLALVEGLCNYLNVSEYSSITSKIKYISCSQHLLSIIDEECDEINTLNNLVAIGLNSKGDFTNALVYAEKALKYAKKIGDDHKVYQTYSTLGMINRHLGNLKVSFEMYEKAIDIIEGSSPKYITSLQVYLNFATLLEQFGDSKHLNQAKELYEYVFKELELFLESNTSEKGYLVLLATTLNSLGKIYTLLDEYEKAITFQQDAYDKLIILLGNNHEVVGICANNLGLAYAYNKDFINSLKYHLISVSIQEEIFEENHPEVSISKSGLANAYKNVGEIDKAKLIFKEVLEIGEKNLPKNHPTLARRKSNYATLCTKESEREIAKKLYFEAIEIDSFNYGDKNPNIATCNLNLGTLFMQEQNWILASKHLQTAIEIFDCNKINNDFSNSAINYLKIVKKHL